MTEKYFLDYNRIRDNIDLKISEILSFYKTNVKTDVKTDVLCKKGCCGCCTAITLFPVEFFAIKQEIERMRFGNLAKTLALSDFKNTKEGDGCIFLEKSICMIYEARPIICRTQGLPLLYFSDKLEEYTITFCEKNFSSRNEDFEFDTEYAIDLDRLNSSLYKLNKEFIEEINPGLKADKRIPMSLLLSDNISGNKDYKIPTPA